MRKRKKTRFQGVQQRESDSRRHNGKPDIVFTIDYKDATGRRVRKDVGWASEGFTAALASEIRAQLIQEAKTTTLLGNPVTPVIPTLLEAWEKYRNDWLQAQGKSTINGDKYIKNYLQSFLNLKLNQISPYFLDKLISDMSKKGLANQTIRHVIGLMRAIMKRMAKWGFYAGAMPFDKITLPKLNNERQRFLTPEEANSLLDALKERSTDTWLMALISLHCGLRFSEVANLKWGDIRWDENAIYLPKTKNGDSRYAVMTQTVKEALEERRDIQGLVFPDRNGKIRKTASKTFFRAVEALGLNGTPEAPITDTRQRVCFHTLRHTYASWLAKSGQSQITIADRLGHRSLAMTKRYTHLMDETRKASAAAIEVIFHSNLPGNQS